MPESQQTSKPQIADLQTSDDDDEPTTATSTATSKQTPTGTKYLFQGKSLTLVSNCWYFAPIVARDPFWPIGLVVPGTHFGVGPLALRGGTRGMPGLLPWSLGILRLPPQSLEIPRLPSDPEALGREMPESLGIPSLPDTKHISYRI